MKDNSEISESGKGVGRRYIVEGLQHKGEVSIDEDDGIECKGACVGRNWDFA